MYRVVNGIIIVALWLGIRSLSHFSLLYAGMPHLSIVTFDIITFVFIIAISQYALYVPSTSNGEKPRRNLQYLMLLTILSASLLFIGLTIFNPYGLGDAIAIWNLRARYLYYAGLDWDVTFSSVLEFSHLDYPLLIPLNVARSWEVLGQYTPITPAIIATFYTIGTVTLLFYITQKISGRTIAFLSLIALLVLPNYIRWGAGQMADIPLAFYILLSVTLVIIGDDTKYENATILYLLGLALGCASWVKNEGLLFVLAFCIVSLLFLKSHLTIKRWLQIAITFAPFLIVNIIFKSSIDVSNDLVSGQGVETLNRIADLSRYITIVTAYFTIGLPYLILLVLIIVYAVKILKFKTTKPSPFLTTLFILVLSGYFAVFLTTPNPLEWHLETALERLLMQIYPLAILIVASMFSVSMPKADMIESMI